MEVSTGVVAIGARKIIAKSGKVSTISNAKNVRVRATNHVTCRVYGVAVGRVILWVSRLGKKVTN